MRIYNSLHLREIFHLEFLRWFGRKIKPENYALKGGVNLRFFFKSFRYSEDMDLDIYGARVDILKEFVMGILESISFQENLKPFGIEKVVPPNILKAKQTETTQRFKVHLITESGVDLFTKVEFSRRGKKGQAVVEPVSDSILREYKMTPLLVSHYEIHLTIAQKISALAYRSAIQARDVFDLYILSSQYNPEIKENRGLRSFTDDKFKKAYDNIFVITFEQFRDTVLLYLSPEDRTVYETEACWDEIKLKTANFIEEIRRNHA